MKIGEYLKAKAEERAEKYSTKAVNGWPNLLSLDTFIYLGMFSWTMPNIGKRLIQKQHVVNIGWGDQTPTDITRDYLDFKYPKRLKATALQRAAITEHRAFPCMAKRGLYKDMIYYDLSAAYWNITRIVGWDVDYFPGRWLGVNSTVDDFPLPHHKAARSSLVTAGLSSSVRIWTGKELGWKTGNNTHINYGLWALTQDTLHSIASAMLDLGAVYIHTDGYILPAEQERAANEIVESWGLTGGVKERGLAEVFGVGSYAIGNKTTKRTGITPINDWFGIEAKVDYEWLRKRMFALAARLSS